jgi:hypothetical protein
VIHEFCFVLHFHGIWQQIGQMAAPNLPMEMNMPAFSKFGFQIFANDSKLTSFFHILRYKRLF